MDKKEANLLPRLCTSYNDSSSSSEESSDESTDNSDTETKFYGFNKKDLQVAGGGGNAGARKLRRVKKKQSKWTTYVSRFKRFCNSPRVHFVYEKTFFVVFLMLFSYMILCEFTYYEKVELALYNESLSDSNTNISNTSANFTFLPLMVNATESSSSSYNLTDLKYDQDLQAADNATISIRILQNVVKMPSWVEYLLIYWMFALMAEEARQVFILLKL